MFKADLKRLQTIQRLLLKQEGITLRLVFGKLKFKLIKLPKRHGKNTGLTGKMKTLGTI